SVVLSSVFFTCVIPALKRGLKPVGLLASAVSEGVLSCVEFSSAAGADFVTPALKRGLKPAGLFASVVDEGVLSCVEFSSADGVVFVKLDLKRGLKPAGLLVSVSDVFSFLSVTCTGEAVESSTRLSGFAFFSNCSGSCNL